MDELELVSVGTYITEGEAEVVAGLLESAGIETVLKHMVGGAIPTGRVMVMVKEEDLQAANAFLEAEAEPPDAEAEPPDAGE